MEDIAHDDGRPSCPESDTSARHTSPEARRAGWMGADRPGIFTKVRLIPRPTSGMSVNRTMSSRTVESPDITLTFSRTWGGAVAGGIVAGVGMGLIMHFVMGAMPLVGALYGQPTLVAGWIAHLFHSVVFAVVFAAVATRPTFRDYGVYGLTVLGSAYGIVLELVAAGVVLPVWANAVGAAELPVPFLVPMGFLTHLIYGLLLGAVYGGIVTRQRSRMTAVEASERPAL